MAQRQYVSSAVSVLKGDGIVVHVVNDSDTDEHKRHYLHEHGCRGNDSFG